MLAFFENSWALWWLGAIIAILRWFHLLTRYAGRADDTFSNLAAPPRPSLKLPHPSSL